MTRGHEFFFNLVIFVLLGGAVVLKGARLSDSGVIKCVASNILGRCTSTAQFSIEGMNNLLLNCLHGWVQKIQKCADVMHLCSYERNCLINR